MGRRLSPSWRWRVWNTSHTARDRANSEYIWALFIVSSLEQGLLGGQGQEWGPSLASAESSKKERCLFVFDVQMVLPWLISAAWEKTVIYLREDDFGWYSVWFSWAFILKLWFEACLRNWKQLGLNLRAALLWAILNLSRPPRRLHL